jgi:hypothetical protein
MIVISRDMNGTTDQGALDKEKLYDKERNTPYDEEPEVKVFDCRFEDAARKHFGVSWARSLIRKLDVLYGYDLAT